MCNPMGYDRPLPAFYIHIWGAKDTNCSGPSHCIFWGEDMVARAKNTLRKNLEIAQ